MNNKSNKVVMNNRSQTKRKQTYKWMMLNSHNRAYKITNKMMNKEKQMSLIVIMKKMKSKVFQKAYKKNLRRIKVNIKVNP